ncbi:hypothetical protein RPD_4113 [Rhodopseudomonas palustris BisB5]|uniref:Uncharacterized protein n=1 Tax=Rhodopseudomonas palustris (strain BisB5) TaxID=316057 RepID=Q131A7_RHOPS|nr:hypothetical protein RPD_4113 [Rhodopseudomonas palustris BisB5]
MCLFDADFKHFARRRNKSLSGFVQASVNHAGQASVNHARRCSPRKFRLTSLFKRFRTRLWQASPIDRTHNSGGENKAVRRQTATGGRNPAGSSRALRLDPLSLPIRYDAHDTRADGGVRQIELHRERVILHRAVAGMRMAIKVRVSDFRGVGCRGLDDGRMLMLVHRDPSLSVPLCISSDNDEIERAWALWSEIFALPQLPDDTPREAAQRRRRHSVMSRRRPRFLMRRRTGALLNAPRSYAGEREIIARH